MKHFSINEEIQLHENAIFLVKSKALVISDLQLGYEQQLRAMGHNIIYEQAKQMLILLESLIKETKAKMLIINGDLKHEFGKISAQERRDIIGLLGKLKNRVKIVVIRGNHDTMTQQLIEELGVEFVESLELDGVYLLHGHKLPNNMPSTTKSIIIGHAHPAVTINDGVRSERYKCFLIGKYKRKELIVLPSFSTIVEGTDILQKSSRIFSPFMEDINSAKVYVISDEIRSFGTVKQIRNILEKIK